MKSAQHTVHPLACTGSCAVKAVGWSLLIGVLGGLIGLGGAEFRLPLLIGVFGLVSLQAVIANKVLSLLVVSAALLSRLPAVGLEQLWPHRDGVINLLAGSLVGAWWAAGWAMRLSRRTLDAVLFGLLVFLACAMALEQALGLQALPVLQQVLPQWAHIVVGVMAGLTIGMVAAVMGVAGGELLIPAIVLLWGLDVKLAGSVSLLISLPTMLAGFVRYRESAAFQVLRQQRSLLVLMAAGSLLGAVLGGLLVGAVPTQGLGLLLSAVLAVSAWKVFRRSRQA
ncbi:MAG: sulfite exporter TauE/SafE family protein [Thiomonas sp.]|nr:sulfite exporter TauE/SafE family protein [Thiomonas sp.]